MAISLAISECLFFFVGSGPAHGEVGGEPENPMNGNRRVTEGKTCSLFLGVVSLPCRPSHWKPREVSFNRSVGRPCRFAKPSGKPLCTTESRRHCASVTARRKNSARRAYHTARPAECRTRRRNPHTTGKRRTTIPSHGSQAKIANPLALHGWLGAPGVWLGQLGTSMAESR